MKSEYYNESKFKPTRDNWCPNYSNNQVRVRIMCNMENKGKIWHRVCIWGMDDLGLERDFFGAAQEKDALVVYGRVMNLDYVDFKPLKEMGFKSA
jgi:hypothetical protein